MTLRLNQLGLSTDQERLYRHLLREPGAEPARLDIADAQRVVRELQSLGLIDASLIPQAPSAAVDRLIRLRMDEITQDIHRLAGTWDVVRDLAEEQRHGYPVELVERIDGFDNVNRRIRDFSAKTEVLTIKCNPRTSSPNDPYLRNFRARLSTGRLASRTIVSMEALRDPEQLAYAQKMHRLSDLHRATNEPIRNMIIIDRSVAFVRSDPDEQSTGALLIRQSGPVAYLVELFEHEWRNAHEFDDSTLAPVEREVLLALATHAKDDTAARAVNMSVRKFRAHVADLMARLGAASRFQAALRAKERGWL